VEERVDPRVRRTRAAVLTAAAEVLAAGGLSGFSLEAVAQRADVARSTLYRHWPGREHLLVETVAEHGPSVADPDTGRLRDDLLAAVGPFGAFIGDGPSRAMLLSMLAEAAHDPTAATLQQRLTDARRELLRRLVHRAVRRGELPADVDVEQLLDDLAAGVVHRAFVVGAPVDTAYLARHVDRFLAIHGAGPDAIGPRDA
jgi:AcrR family transcriptional regulator